MTAFINNRYDQCRSLISSKWSLTFYEQKTFVVGTLIAAVLGFAASSAMAQNPAEPFNRSAQKPDSVTQNTLLFTEKTAQEFIKEYPTPTELLQEVQDFAPKHPLTTQQKADLTKFCVPNPESDELDLPCYKVLNQIIEKNAKDGYKQSPKWLTGSSTSKR